ncbi:hypothetical protein U0070_023309, partial [Myodes glareolus]
SERPDRTMAEECRENRPSRARDLPTALRLLASASGGRSGQGRVLQNRPRPFRPMGRGLKGGVCGAVSAGWSRWRGAGPRGQRQPAHWAGVAAATAVRVFKVSVLPQRRPDSAAMSAAEEVDGLGVVRPHYGSVLDNERLTAEEMDERRRQNVAYEYLCHLEEAKR